MGFDYVIVGGGSAGATLAMRLTENPKTTVCLLEAGGDGKDLTIKVPALAAGAINNKNTSWRFDTVPQKGLNGRRGHQPRGKALGGSSSINGMIYTRGNRKDYDLWEDMGCEGWGYEDILPYFKKSEFNSRGEDDFHGGTGPLHVSDNFYDTQIAQDFYEACAANQIHKNMDFNGAVQTGAGPYQVTQFHDEDRRGTRSSTAAAFLFPNLSRKNLNIITHAQASKITFDGQRASGVEYSQKGNIKSVKARAEVILCAGAFQSPQLLMLSGVGDSSELRRHGIETVRHNPNVGKNLQDHIDMLMGYRVTDKETFSVSPVRLLRALTKIPEYKKNGTGFWSSNLIQAGAFYSVNDSPHDWPNIQIHFMQIYAANHGRKLSTKYTIGCHVCILRPQSRGSVSLASSNPLDAPLIDPNFLGEDKDMQDLLAGVKKARQIMATPPLADKVIKDLCFENANSDADVMEVIRNTADTVYHPVGTCRMGSDDAAVVDTELRVLGIEGLRVVDASIMPQVISGNTNAPTIMIAEKAADLIKQSAAV